MHDAGAIRTDGGEEVLRLEPVDDIVELLAVAREEQGSRARTVADADNVSLNILRAVVRGSEGLVVPSVTGRSISNGVFVEAYERALESTVVRGYGGSVAVPGSLKRGYGLVAMPMLNRVFSGLS
jgi:hypothetical protein